MSGESKQGLLLGKHTPVVETYSPGLLYPVPRALARESLLASTALPFHGVDIWHAYELSWLNKDGIPRARVGRFLVPATSPNLVESKSFKLYLNSLNFTRFESDSAARETIVADLSAAAGESVQLELFDVDSPQLAGTALPGECLDGLSIAVVDQGPSAELLRTGRNRVVQRLFSHLLRSLCPVTGQPDWATIWFDYRGPELDPEALLAYVIAFRRHQEFHEQCVERMFVDIAAACRPDYLSIQAFYTRRGGLDINPFRSTDADARPLPRLNRQ